MPQSKELKTWEGKPQWRWKKMYRGRLIYISCKEMGLPRSLWTQKDSYPYAMQVWRQRKLAIDNEEEAASRQALRPLLPFEDLAGAVLGDVRALDKPEAIVDVFLAEAERKGEEAKRRLTYTPTVVDPETEAVDPHATEAANQIDPHDPDAERRAAIRAVFLQLADRCILSGQPLPESVAAVLPPARVQQVQTSILDLRGEPAVLPEKSVKALHDRWVKRQHDQAQAGKITPGRADNNRICLGHLLAFLGESADVEKCIDADHLDAFYLHCRGKMQERLDDPKRKAGWSADYAKKVFDTARRFIRDLWELKWAEVVLPRNIDSKGFRFNVGAKAVKTWEPEEFQTVLAAAQTWRQMPLHLLLMANCGYRHQDIADVKQCEVDWVRGRIIRARSKIDDQENAPVVNYRLWPRTFELLRQHRNPDHSPHARVLLTESGQPWVWSKLVDAEGGIRKLKSSNNINSNFSHLRKRIGFDKPLSQIRKMGASLLEKEFHKCVPEYLGEAPGSVKDKSYVRPDQEYFDRAIFWLGQQLGQVPVEDKPTEPARQAKGRKRQAT